MSKLKYNPNKKPQKIEFATYAPDRTTRPEFKLHKRRSDALNAVGHNTILYKLIGDEWIEIFRWDDENDPRLDNCEDCGEPLWRDGLSNYSPYKYFIGRHKWRDTDTMKPYMNWYCYKCRRKHE